MNQHLYRIVFNRALGVLQVVAEIARRTVGGRAASGGGAVTATVPRLRFSLWCALGFVCLAATLDASPVYAQGGRIVGDANAPGHQRPTVLDNGNGVPVVNITTPSAAGVSRNRYSQFDVGTQGAILNNSRGTAPTQLGGPIAGNPWLATGSAKVILNEVNGPASQLNGFVEVAGQRAEVVIANPAGIQVNGGGFINASRATLTTGTPVFNGGALDHYRVEGGTVRIDGNGFNTRGSDGNGADYTALIARAVELNGKVWANELQVTIGANTVSTDHAQIAAIAPTGAAPTFALDVSALGGMYANKISLVGNEHGVGVRNAGDIGAQAGELTVTIDGRLENRGQLQAQTNTRVDASGGVANTGTVSAVRELAITTSADVDNSSGTLNAGRIAVDAQRLRNRGGSIEQTGLQALALSTGTLTNRDGGRIGMAAAAPGAGGTPGLGGGSSGGTDPDSGSGTGGQGGGGSTGGGTLPLPEPLVDGALNIAGVLDNDGGVINAGGGVTLSTADGLDNSGGRLGLRNLTLTRGDLGNAGGELNVSGDANLAVGRITNDAGSLAVGGVLQVDAQQLSNRGGTLSQGGTGVSGIRAAAFDNTDGVLSTNATALSLDSAVLVNERGRIEHAGSDGLSLRADTLRGAEGRIATAGALTVGADQIDHRGATLSAAQVTLTANRVDNRGGRMLASGTGANTLTVRDTLDNGADGLIATQGDLTLRADTFGNAGGTIQQAGSGTLAIDATTLNGAGGTLASNGALRVTGTTTDLRGGTTAAQSVSVDTGTLVTAGGTLTAAGTDALRLTARDRLDNTSGQIATNGALHVQAGALTNADGTISAAGADASGLRVTDALDNRGGTIATAGALDVEAGDLNNTGGTLQVASEEGLTIAAAGRLTNDGGTIASNGAIDLAARTLSNHGGTVQSAQAITATVADVFDNTAGTVVAGGDLKIDAASLLNRDTFDPGATDPSAQKGLFGQQVNVRADVIDNTRGQLHAADTLMLRGRSQPGTALTNAGGTIDGSRSVDVAATHLDNAGGTLIQRGADGALTVNVDGTLANTAGGLIGAEGRAGVSVGTLDNRAGTLFAKTGLTLTSTGDTLNRDGGLLQSNGDLTISAGGALDNTDGTVDVTGRAVLDAARIDNVRGQVLAGGSIDETALTVSTSVLNNQGGTIGSREGDVVLDVASIDNAAGGKIAAARDLTFTTTTLDNAGGTVFANRHLVYQNAGGTLDNAAGQFGAGDTAWVTLANISNTNGGRIQAGTVWLTTPTLDIGGGEVAAHTLHANLTTLTGLGRLYGAQWLDVDFSGDFAYENGQRFESDGLLDLAVAGTFINHGTLQTAGELALSAANVVNEGAIKASNAGGTGLARITAVGTIDNRSGASIEGDTVALTATDVTNTSREGIVGDVVGISADTLTNGRDLANQEAAVDYGEGFIGAAEYLDLRIGQRLSNLDGDIFSAGDMDIRGRTDGERVAVVENVSGRIQAEGDATIAAEVLVNERRMIGTAQVALTPEEAYALGSQRQFNEAFATLSPAERAAFERMGQSQPSGLSPAEETALFRKLGWVGATDVSDELRAALNAVYNARAQSQGHRSGEFVGPIRADLKQDDVYRTGTQLVDASTSAAGQIVTGGDMTLDVGQRVRNHASQIAAGGYLTIAGQSYTGTSEGSDARIDNIAVIGQYEGERTTTAWTREGAEGRFQLSDGAWRTNPAVQEGASVTHAMTFAGPTLLTASITAGQGLSIQAGDVSNTAVSAGSGLGHMSGGHLGGPGSTGLGNAAGGAGATGPGGPSGVGSQVVGTPERPLPGLVPSDNGMFDLHADPSSPFLVTTAPRFAKGDGAGSNYLLGRLGVTTDLHKRLGDGYYEQRLIMEQILALTGRRSLTGNGDGFEQYRALMDHAAEEAARLGFALGAPLTSAQIGALNQDIVWLVEQEVNGQKVLVPVVYLSRATADRMKAEGALMAADTLDIQSTGTVRNDGTLDSTRGTWLSADTLINEGAIRSEGRVDIATRGDTINRGKLVGNTVVIDAGGDVINTVRFDGVNATGGVINAGAGGLSISSGRDVIQQGTVTSAGHVVVSAGRDFVQNAAVANAPAGVVTAAAGTLTTGGSAVITTGRDVILDQSRIEAGQHVVIDAGRDAHFIAADVSAGGSVAVRAAGDIVSHAVSDTHTTLVQEKQGRTTTVTTTIDQTITGSTFQSGGSTVMEAGGKLILDSAQLDAGGQALLSGKEGVYLLAQTETDSTHAESHTKGSGPLGRDKDVQETSSTTRAVTTGIHSGGGIAIESDGRIVSQAATLNGGEAGVSLSASQVEFQSVAETDSYQRQSQTESWAWQSQDDRGRVETTQRQGQITGPLTIHSGEVIAEIGQREGESIEAALHRQTQVPGQEWLAKLDPNSTQFRGTAEALETWHEHQEGLSPELAAIAAVALAIWVGPAAAGAVGGGFTGAVVGGAAAGAASSAANAGLQGRDDWQDAAAQGAWTGALSGGLFYGAGTLTNGYAAGSWQKVLAHSAAGGIADVAGGGSFWNGALSAGVSEAGSPWIDATWDGTTGRSVGHAGLGAASSALTGGNRDAILQGAINGGFGYWFNEQLHYVQTPDGQMTVESPGERYPEMANAFEMLPGVMALKCMVDGCTAFEKTIAALDFLPLGVVGEGVEAGVKSVGIWSAKPGVTAVENAFGHWMKHASEFPHLQNAKQYVEAATDFAKNPPKTALTKIRANGDKIIFDPVTNVFVATTKNGVPKTMFKPNPDKHGYPTNLDYFNGQ